MTTEHVTAAAGERPSTITCVDCGQERAVRSRGIVPRYCEECSARELQYRHRNQRPRPVPKRTESLRYLLRTRKLRLPIAYPNVQRPRTRGECVDAPRPCPFVSCRYHLYLDTTGAGGVTLNFPDLEPEELAESCALDVADGGGETLERVGELCNFTRERTRQVEAIAKSRTAPELEGLAAELEGLDA